MRENHIKSEHDWLAFQLIYADFPPNIHPKLKSVNIWMALGLWTVFCIGLAGLFYCLFIIIQLSLYNFIMAVVMVVFWWRLCGVSHSIIRRILDNGKKKEYKAYFDR